MDTKKYNWVPRPLIGLTEVELRALAESKLVPRQTQRLEQLQRLKREGKLPPPLKAELEALEEESNRVTLVKANADYTLRLYADPWLKRAETTIVPIFPSQPSLSRQIVTPKTLRALTDEIVKAIKPEAIILFGSYAYGQPTPESDVDLLIIWNTRKSAHARYRTISSRVRPHPFALDFLVCSPREIASARKWGDPFLCEILRQGKTLYARQSNAD